MSRARTVVYTRWGRWAASLALAAMLVNVTPALALQPDEVLADPALEKRARAISLGLRCLVCQNQSIDDSDADVAKDLRKVVRQRLVAGDADDDVRNYVVARYGDFVLLKPPLNARTVLLWGSPVLVLLFGAGLVIWSRRSSDACPDSLSADEAAALAAVLQSGTGSKQPPGSGTSDVPSP